MELSAQSAPPAKLPERRLVSVVVPCMDEEDILPQTIDRLLSLANDTPEFQFEFVFVDDGSTDQTMNILRDHAMQDGRIRALSFSRNFGHQIAVSAGIEDARGDCVVLIDADLQDPPEVIPQMLEKWQEGYDVIYGVRASRAGESAFKLASAKAFYRVLSKMSDVKIPLDTGDFRLMSRPVVEVMRNMPEQHRFVRGMVAWAGFRQFALKYERAERAAGVSKYPLRKMMNFALDGIVSFSTKPLRIATGIGLIASILAVIGIFYALVLRVFTSTWVEGWTALMLAVLFIGGVQLIALGVIGEYVGRVYEETKRRPLYVIRERVGQQETPALPERRDREVSHVTG